MILRWLRRLLGIRSPTHEYLDAMRYFWRGWESGRARAQWKRRHRLARIRARRARGAPEPRGQK